MPIKAIYIQQDTLAFEKEPKMKPWSVNIAFLHVAIHGVYICSLSLRFLLAPYLLQTLSLRLPHPGAHTIC